MSRRIPVWVSGLAIVALVATVFALTRSDGHNSAAAAATASTDAHIALIASTSHAPVAATNVPHLAEAVDGAPAHKATPDVAAAREALITASGMKVVAVPADGQVCADIVIPSSVGQQSTNCVSNEVFNAQGAWHVLGTPPSVDVIGLVPDGVQSVTVTFMDGSSKTATVTNNAFDVHSSVDSKSISFKTPDGAYTGPAFSGPLN